MFYWYGIQVMWLAIGVVVGFVLCALISVGDNHYLDMLREETAKNLQLTAENKKLNNLLDQIQDLTKKWG